VPARSQILSELTRETTSQKPQQQQQQQNASSSQPKQQAKGKKKKKQTNKPTFGCQLTTESCFKEKTQIFLDKTSSTKLLLV
jgi:hypothetical protein